jgi:hypothetical protein
MACIVFSAVLQLPVQLLAVDVGLVTRRAGVALLRREGQDAGGEGIQLATGKAKEKGVDGSDPTYYGKPTAGKSVYQRADQVAAGAATTSFVEKNLSYMDKDWPLACSKPPCCPVVGCAPKWKWNHQEYSGCTDADSTGQFWCSEQAVMTSTSSWHWCIPNECPSGAGTTFNAEDSSKVLEVPANGGCLAPQNVDSSATVSCAEGSTIKMSSWCTPRCAGGKIVSINLTALPASSSCGTTTSRGNKLCCTAGEFSPPTFTCGKATFGQIDRDADGLISREEYDWAYGNVAAQLARAEAIHSAPPAKATNRHAGNIMNDADFNPITYFYIKGTAAMFCAIGIYMMLQVFFGARRLGKSHTVDTVPPNELIVTAPNDCGGPYALQDVIAGGHPTWKHTSAEFYIYLGTDGNWIIGGAAEKSKRFVCDTGLIASTSEHDGVWPHGVGRGNWSVFDGKTFVPNPSVNIIHAEPARLEVLTNTRGAGIYVLVPDQRPNGFPLWACEDGQHWIYGGLAGQWFVGGPAEQAAAFACDVGVVATVTLHDGALPNQIGQGNWMTFDGEQWLIDPNINVVLSLTQ